MWYHTCCVTGETTEKNMKKFLILALAALAFSFTIADDFISTKVSSHLNMSIHKDLEVTPVVALSEFEKRKAPMAAYRSEDQDAKLIIRLIKEVADTVTSKKYKNREAKKSTQRDLKLEKMFKKSSLLNQFEKITFYQDTIKEINGKESIVFEYTGSLSGVNQNEEKITTTTYSYYQIVYVKNKTYILHFYCPEDRKAEWQAHAQTMLNSVKIRG